MCGFTGYFDPRADHNELIINKMTDSLLNRGPDSSGIFIDKNIGISLGHRRLSIQDLSDNGIQPMRSESNRFIIVFNGEIYNHFKIRDHINNKEQNKIWKGHSDTETLLSSIEILGLEESLNLINGMFAFALLDSWNKKLFLCRDRYGEKPLYYGMINNVLFFGSQPKSFKSHPKWKGEISNKGLKEYFHRGYITGQKSIYKGIYKLLPAKYICINLDDINLLNCKNYWKHKKNNFYFSNTEELINKLDKELENSIISMTISDRKIGSFLSGGVDSSLITYYLQKQFSQPIDTFTIGFEDKNYDETESAKKISNYLGTHHNEVIFNTENILDLIAKLPNIWDEPFSDPSQLPTLLLSEIATKKVKVAFSGDGGDELFCGYTRYNQGYNIYKFIQNSPNYLKNSYEFFLRLISSDYSLSFFRLWPELIRPNSIIDRTNKLERLLKLSSSKDFYSELNILFSNEDSLFLDQNLDYEKNLISPDNYLDYREYMIERDIMEYLPDDILTKVDRSSMFNGLEVRVPFLDYEFASWARNIPLSLKTLKGKGKWPLKKLLSSKIPNSFFKKPKKGFGIPLNKILNDNLKDIVYEKLSSSKIKSQGIFNDSYIQNMIESHYSRNRRFHNQIWSLLIFQLWFDANI